MGFSRKIIAVCILVFLMIISLPGVGAAEDEVNVGLITAPFGTGSYVLGVALEEISKKNHPWLRISHMESPGLVFNIKKMEKDENFEKTSIVSSADTLLWFARNGVKPLKEKMGEGRPYSGRVQPERHLVRNP